MKTKFILQIIVVLFCSFALLSCEDYLEIDNPFEQILHDQVFNDEATATAAVTTLYAKLRNETLISGGQNGLGFLMGLYADELDYFAYGQPAEKIYRHQIIASDNVVQNIWNSSYNLVYMSNSILEGLEKSSNLTDDAKNQLKGETLFVRSLVNFYLVNLFGSCPYIIETDYQKNSKINKISEAEIYDNIIKDLKKAKSLLSNSYITNERTRPNKWVASSLLSRIYLYLKQWENAENESSQIINNTSLYNLETDIDKVFLKDSPSVIWQLKPKNEGDNTLEGQLYFLASTPPQISALNPQFVLDMKPNDLRKQNWIEEITDGTNFWYFPHKYKENQNTGTSFEYSIIFRLAEQYLIRAEAKARLGNITGAQNDINIIRARAGLEETEATDTEELVQAILNERRFELFTEHGHRWFDLRRLELANQVLAPIKTGWKPTDILFPIPESELLINPNLNPQNPGY